MMTLRAMTTTRKMTITNTVEDFRTQGGEPHMPIPRFVNLVAATANGDSVRVHPCSCSCMQYWWPQWAVLVCDNSNNMSRSYSLDDIMPEGVVPNGLCLCPTHAPSAGGDGATYSDIWIHAETLDDIIKGTTSVSNITRVRSKRYRWDNDKQQLFTTAEHPRIIPQPGHRQMLAKAAHEALGHRTYGSMCVALRLDYRWYHPQTQGLVERVNQTLQRAMSVYVGKQHDSWLKYVYNAAFPVHTSKQASTKYPPSYSVNEMQARLPLQLQFQVCCKWLAWLM
jgi:hypothetical protein